jgi:predicted transcriptional regulator
MSKILTRKLLRDKIQKVYRTQDRFAYETGINSAILSRIINCTLDPTDDQIKILCNKLEMSEREVNKKDE